MPEGGPAALMASVRARCLLAAGFKVAAPALPRLRGCIGSAAPDPSYSCAIRHTEESVFQTCSSSVIS